MVESALRACLITNPRSGSGGIDLACVLPVLQEHGWHIDIRQKLHGGHATELAEQAAEDSYDIVVAAGGDGTLSEIVDGLAGTDLAVGVLPGGTVNLWTRELGISPRLEVAARQLVGATRRRVDVGHLRVNGRHGRHFLLMAGLGFDGATMARVSKPLKNRIGPLAVGLAAVQALPRFGAVPVQVMLDGVRWQGQVAQIVVGNTRLYGGFTSITPNALIDDGLLDVCLIGVSGPLSAGRQLASLLARGRPSSVGAESYRAGSIVIQAPVLLPVQVDGGAMRLKKEKSSSDGVTYTFTAIAQGLTMLLPRGYAGNLFAHDGMPTLHRQSAQAPHAPAAGDEDPLPDEDHDKPGKGQVRIMAVGPDTFTGARVRSGKVVTVLLDRDTVLTDPAGARQPANGLLSTLRAGQIVRVQGDKDRERGIIQAREIRLLD